VGGDEPITAANLGHQGRPASTPRRAIGKARTGAAAHGPSGAATHATPPAEPASSNRLGGVNGYWQTGTQKRKKGFRPFRRG